MIIEKFGHISLNCYLCFFLTCHTYILFLTFFIFFGVPQDSEIAIVLSISNHCDFLISFFKCLDHYKYCLFKLFYSFDLFRIFPSRRFILILEIPYRVYKVHGWVKCTPLTIACLHSISVSSLWMWMCMCVVASTPSVGVQRHHRRHNQDVRLVRGVADPKRKNRSWWCHKLVPVALLACPCLHEAGNCSSVR